MFIQYDNTPPNLTHPPPPPPPPHPGPPPLPRFEVDYFQEIITRRLCPRRLFAGDCSEKTIPRRLCHINYSKNCSKDTIRGIPHQHHSLPNNTPTPHRNLEAKRIAYHV